MPKFIITKSAEPEALGDAYASSLQQLPGGEENLTPDLPVILKSREMSEDVARMVAERTHVLSVELDHDARAMGFASVQAAENMTPDAIKRALGVDRCHEQGIRGAGQRSAVIDSGLGVAFAEKYASSIIEKRDYTGEGWQSPDDTHGEWCASAVLMVAPDAKVGIYKALSGKTGSGSYSGIIRAVNDAVTAGYTGITMSLGGPKSQALNAAIDAAEDRGVFTTSAAGNEQRNSNRKTADETSGASASKGTTCGSKRSDGITSDYSNWGDCLDVGCYGENVQAPDVAGFWDGTSMSTPMIQGIALLVRSTGATHQEAKKRLYGACRKTGEPAYKEGYGLVDAAAAVLGSAPVPPPEPPKEEPTKPIKKLSYSRLSAVGIPVPEPYEVTLRRGGQTRTLGFIYPGRR
jgi:hypothetical protein